MKFSNSAHGFYPSEEKILAEYKVLPEDLIDISEEDWDNFLTGKFGPSVELSADGRLQTKVNSTFIDYKASARELRNSLRNKIDTFLLPAATISDVLVSEEQKNTLIQDSLLLAKWPAQEGWPYIVLPDLSDLCKSIMTIPEWSYLIQPAT